MKACVCWYEQSETATVSFSLLRFCGRSPSPVLQPGRGYRRCRKSFSTSVALSWSVDNSAMIIKNGVTKNPLKRKRKEVAVENTEPTPATASQINLFNLQSQHFASPNSFPNTPPTINGSKSQVQQILNAAAPFKSFTSMLAFAEEDGYNCLPPHIKHQSKEIDKIITTHGENLQRTLAVMMEMNHHSVHSAVGESTATKLKETELKILAKSNQNAKLEKKVEHYQKEVRRLEGKLRCLEQMAMSLQAGLENAKEARQVGENAEEDAESSSGDVNGLGPVRLECKACQRQIATVMMWPCRHVCVCTLCDAVNKACPVCRSLKTTSVEVLLPLD